MLTHRHLHCQLELITVWAAAFIAAAPPASAQVGLALAPMREELQLAPGAQHSGVLTLANDTTEKTRVMGELLDFFLDQTATPQFGRYPQESEYSCQPWLLLNPVEAELNGKSQLTARYTIRVPQNAQERSYHCAVGFTTRPTAENARGMGLRMAVQIVCSIYVVVGKPRVEGSVKDLRLEYVADAKSPVWRAVVVFNNPGAMHFRPIGDLDVLSQSGEVVESVKFTPLPVLPKRDQKFTLPLKLAGGPGKYTLRARVDIGGDEIQEATADVVAQKPAP
jgi:P pilus assembly chaperone PapD